VCPGAGGFGADLCGDTTGVTDGLAVLIGWVEFGLLLSALAFVLLRGGVER